VAVTLSLSFQPHFDGLKMKIKVCHAPFGEVLNHAASNRNLRYSYSLSLSALSDATEVYIEKPSLPDLPQMIFSSYKNKNTFKVLVGISPSEAITFISILYSGSISDKELTRQIGILALLERDDSVMADRGFDIEANLIPLGVKLNISPFLKNKSQLSEKEMIETRHITSVCFHVERAMECIKKYHIYGKDIPSYLTDLADQIFLYALF